MRKLFANTPVGNSLVMAGLLPVLLFCISPVRCSGRRHQRRGAMQVRTVGQESRSSQIDRRGAAWPALACWQSRHTMRAAGTPCPAREDRSGTDTLKTRVAILSADDVGARAPGSSKRLKVEERLGAVARSMDQRAQAPKALAEFNAMIGDLAQVLYQVTETQSHVRSGASPHGARRLGQRRRRAGSNGDRRARFSTRNSPRGHSGFCALSRRTGWYLGIAVNFTDGAVRERWPGLPTRGTKDVLEFRALALKTLFEPAPSPRPRRSGSEKPAPMSANWRTSN